MSIFHARVNFARIREISSGTLCVKTFQNILFCFDPCLYLLGMFVVFIIGTLKNVI